MSVDAIALERAERPAASAWLFSRRTDLLVFVLPAVVSLGLVGAGLLTGAAYGDTPPGLWLLGVLFVDVAHVWSTTYRVYTDGEEVRRRPWLYLGAPVAVFAVGVGLHLVSALLFWRVLAYAAVFHFVRQQYGWVMLYRRRAGERDRAGKLIDGAAIYLATLYPLVFWHAAAPRHFSWFVPGDFVLGLVPPLLAQAVGALYVLSLLAYLAKAVRDASAGRTISWGKHWLVASTAVCWYVGIVALDSDFVFTVTNVLIHGVPYFALVWRYGSHRYSAEPTRIGALFRRGWPLYYLTLVIAALLEEGLWNGLVWHDHPQFFGRLGVILTPLALALVVPLLAVPQAVHYLLDGFIWRVGPKNPRLREHLALDRSP